MVLAASLPLVAALLLPSLFSGPVAPTTPEVASTLLLKTGTTWDGAPITYAKTDKPEVQTVVVEIAAGAATAWHLHPVNNIAYIIEGKVRLELETGATQEYKAGQSFAEVVNTWHRGVNIGQGPLRIYVVYLGSAGMSTSSSRGDKRPDQP